MFINVDIAYGLLVYWLILTNRKKDCNWKIYKHFQYNKNIFRLLYRKYINNKKNYLAILK